MSPSLLDTECAVDSGVRACVRPVHIPAGSPLQDQRHVSSYHAVFCFFNADRKQSHFVFLFFFPPSPSVR